jgi:hypothetical protein
LHSASHWSFLLYLRLFVLMPRWICISL